MATERKPDNRRGELAIIFAVILGIALGTVIKRVRIGILLGLVLGLLIVAGSWLRSTRK